MTRQEYEAKYGTPPVASAPVKMTRAEYEAKYGQPVTPPEKTTSFGGDVVRGVIKPFARLGANLANIPRVARGEEVKSLQSKYLGEIKPVGTDKNRSFVGNVLDAVGVGADIGSNLIGLEGVGAAGKSLAKGVIKNVPKQLAKEGFVAGATQGFGSALQEPEASVGRVVGQTVLGGAIGGGTGLVLGGVGARIARPKGLLPRATEKSIRKTEQELFNIENNYAKLRKNQKFSSDGNQATRSRIAKTGVLSDAVDETGTIRTQKAVERYRAQTVDGAEDVVRKNLERLGETTDLDIVEKKLTQQVLNSGLEGSELRTALNNVKKEIAGYRLRATNNKVPNTLLHDAKISTTKGIDFNTPSEVKRYKKAIAKGLKEVVEENSSFNVKQVNDELKPFLKDLEYLEALDGRKVKGGKLSKYTARIAGNIAGGIAGGSVGGFPGSALGTVVGGEIGDRIQGAALSRTFGKATGIKLPKSKILEKAIDTGNSPRLQLPAPKPGAPRIQMESGKTINLPRRSDSTIENQSRQAFQAQKIAPPTKIPKNVAIPKSKPTKGSLVNELEEAKKRYDKKLREVSPGQSESWYKYQLNNQPFVKNPEKFGFKSNVDTKDSLLNTLTPEQRKAFDNGTPKEQEAALAYLRLKTDMKNNPKGYGLVGEKTEARKYKTLDSFIKSHGTPVYHGSDAADLIEKEGFKKMPIKTGVSAFGEGTYLTTKKGDAKGYGKIVKAYLPKDIKLKKISDSDAYTVDTKKLIQEGYDGVELSVGDSKNITIFDPSKIKTETQLKEIYKKAFAGAPIALFGGEKIISDNDEYTSKKKGLFGNRVIFERKDKGIPATVDKPVDKPAKARELTDLPVTVKEETIRSKEEKHNLPKGILKTILTLESSMGTDKRSADPGEMKWLTGLSQVALEDIKRKIDVNNTLEVLDATAEFLALQRKRDPNISWGELYWKRYGPKGLPRSKIEEFNRLLAYYGQGE